MVERGLGDREVASGPGGPPYSRVTPHFYSKDEELELTLQEMLATVR